MTTILVVAIFSFIVAASGLPYDVQRQQGWSDNYEQIKNEKPFDQFKEASPIDQIKVEKTLDKDPYVDQGKVEKPLDKELYVDQGKVEKPFDKDDQGKVEKPFDKDPYVDQGKVENPFDKANADPSIPIKFPHPDEAKKSPYDQSIYNPSNKDASISTVYTDKGGNKPDDKIPGHGVSISTDYGKIDKADAGGDLGKKVEHKVPESTYDIGLKPADKPVGGEPESTYDIGLKPADKPVGGDSSFNTGNKEHDKKIDGKYDITNPESSYDLGIKPADKPVVVDGSWNGKDEKKETEAKVDISGTGSGGHFKPTESSYDLGIKPVDKPVVVDGSWNGKDKKKETEGKVDISGSGLEAGIGKEGYPKDTDGGFGIGLGVKPLDTEKPFVKEDTYPNSKFPDQSSDKFPDQPDNKYPGENDKKIPIYEKGIDGGSGGKHWTKKVEDKWNTFKENTGRSFHKKIDTFRHTADEVAKSVGATFHSISSFVTGTIPQLWGKFEGFLSHYDKKIHRGAGYAVRKITATFDEVKASKLITKLQKRMEEGDEIVDKFFKKLGEKVATWKDKSPQANIDDGLVYKEGEQMTQHYNMPNLPNIFQDEEIQQQMNKMVDEGIFEQGDMSVLIGKKDEPLGVFKEIKY